MTAKILLEISGTGYVLTVAQATQVMGLLLNAQQMKPALYASDTTNQNQWFLLSHDSDEREQLSIIPLPKKSKMIDEEVEKNAKEQWREAYKKSEVDCVEPVQN